MRRQKFLRSESRPPAIDILQSVHLPSIDGVRAVSILWVIGGHFLEQHLPAKTYSALMIGEFFPASRGVTVFFVISGLLITRLLVREEMAESSIKISRFYYRRALRILPAVNTYLFTILVLSLIGYISIPLFEIFLAFSFSFNYATRTFPWWVAHTWSLCVEEQFYLLWAPCFAYFGSRTCLRIGFVAVLLVPLLRLGTYFLFPTLRDKLGWLFHARADSLMFGAIIPLLWKEPRAVSWLLKISRRPFILGSFFYLLVVGPLSNLSIRGYQVICGYSLDSIAIFLLVLGVILNPESRPASLLNHPWLRRIGVLSYSLYLWQQLTIGFTVGKSSLTLVLSIPILFGVAWLSYSFIEKPFLKLRGRFTSPVAK